MKVIQRLLMGLGAVLLLALALQLVAPKAAHAVVSTLVTIANTAANPVITQAGDNHARTAIALQCVVFGDLGEFNAGCGLGTGLPGAGAFQVPAGQRLVIDQVSGALFVPVGSTPSGIVVDATHGDPSNSSFPTIYMNFVPTQIGSDSRGMYYSFSTPMTGYIDPNYELVASCFQTNPSVQVQMSCSFTLFGHLENIS
jgi:hypothetical protein